MKTPMLRTRPGTWNWTRASASSIPTTAAASRGTFTYYQVNETVTETRTLSTDPGKILSGGSMTLTGTVTNDKSQIAAGGALSVVGPNINNIGAGGERVITRVGTATVTQERSKGRKEYSSDYNVTPGRPTDRTARGHVRRQRPRQPERSETRRHRHHRARPRAGGQRGPARRHRGPHRLQPGQHSRQPALRRQQPAGRALYRRHRPALHGPAALRVQRLPVRPVAPVRRHAGSPNGQLGRRRRHAGRLAPGQLGCADSAGREVPHALGPAQAPGRRLL